MDSLLWTFEKVQRFTTYPDFQVRRWAQDRLINLFPEQCGPALVDMLDDENEYLLLPAVEFLVHTGDRARYGPPLLAHLQTASGWRFDYLAQALARLQVREALPLILDRFTNQITASGSPRYLELARALGTFGGADARRALWAAIHAAPLDVTWASNLDIALLAAAVPADVAQLFDYYRQLPPSATTSRRLLAVATATSVWPLADTLAPSEETSFAGVLESATWWLRQAPSLSQAVLDGLAATYQENIPLFLDNSRRAARDLIETRGDPVSDWRAAWEAGSPPAGYRRSAVLTLEILDALVGHPDLLQTMDRAARALALALLFDLSVNRDDQARLETAADADAMALTILAENRYSVLPGIVERVAAQGPAAVPQLVTLLQHSEFSWSMARAAQALALIARRHPGSCAAAIPALIETIREGSEESLLEACSAALAAIGPAAVEPISHHLQDDDITRQIYLTGALGEIPTERAAKALLDLLETQGVGDDFLITALVDIGSPTAIAPLHARWQQAPSEIPQALTVLSILNDLEMPDLPLWPQVITQDVARLAQESAGEPLGPSIPLVRSHGSSRSAKGPGKKERKKRAQQRKKSKKKR